MGSELAKTRPGRLTARADVDLELAQQILFNWLAGRPATTRAARAADLKAFGHFAFGIVDPVEVAAQLFALGAFQAKTVAAAWDESAALDGLADTTRARRLTTLRGLVLEAGEWGLTWTLRVRGPSWTAYGRATATPQARVQAAIAELEAAERWRDLALVLLLYESGLRVTEAVTAQAQAVDLEQRQLRAVRKRVGEIWVPITARCAAVLERLPRFGFIFPSSRPSRSGHLSRQGAHRLIARLGLTYPHALRHAGAIEAEQLTGGDLRRVQGWLGHKHLSTTQVYLGRIAGVARGVVDLLGEGG
jgi:integrase